MFGWFKPRCPCDDHAKAWIEERLHWLYGEFEDNVYNGRKMILPLETFFPEKYDGSHNSIRALFRRVCTYMDLDADDLKLVIKDELKRNLWLVNDAGHLLPTGTAGTYEWDRITIDQAEAHDPMGLVGTMAHELAHQRLLGEGRYDVDYFDNELMTDLTVVYLGLGIFLANSVRHYRSLDKFWPDTKARRPEYMTPPMFAWALAHVAWHNNERWPAWAVHLKSGQRADLKQALKYLWITEDSTFRP